MSSPPPGASQRPLSLSTFRLIRTLVYEESGIFLPDTKQALVERRLAKRLRELGLGSYLAYFHRVRDDADGDERAAMMDCIATNETSFFREPRHWELLEERLIPRWKELAAARQGPKRIRAWSAACSSGEEPYSLAMTLLFHLPAKEGWTVEILATDISQQMLARARQATWPADRCSGIPEQYLKRYMLRGTGSKSGLVRAGRELRSAVRFERLNLNADTYPIQGNLDLVFCRNVLIYFGPEAKERVIERILQLVGADGYLFVGHAESLIHLSDRIRTVIPTVYRRVFPAPDAAPDAAPGPGQRRTGR